jgi:hypothetical protein
VAAERRAVPARQDRGQAAGLRARRPVTHAIHASVLAMKQTLIDPPLDGVTAEAGLEQLGVGDDAVLVAGDPGYLTLR